MQPMKKRNGQNGEQRLYLGVDIGGTKVQASLVRESGEIIEREKHPTPRNCDAESELAAIEQCMADILRKANISASQLAAIGVAVPGVVEPDCGRIVVTPNMSLRDVPLGPRLEAKFQTPVIIGNDGNFGALGETWLGSARKAKSVLYMCVGTGIGSGLVLRGKLWRGDRESAGEIGHMVMQLHGPKCGCGNEGCFEALASRTAIERDIRAAIAAGQPSVLTELAGSDLSVIRSGMIRKAIEQNDAVVTGVVRRAAEVLGFACVNVRHLIDPEAIVLGGGVIVACGSYIMPIIEQVVAADRLPGSHEGGSVLVSALGDDAVVLGAVAAARRLVGRNPFKKRFQVVPTYPQISRIAAGEITIDKKNHAGDVFITVAGKVKKRGDEAVCESENAARAVGVKELEKICKGGPEVLFIGAGESDSMELTEDARRFLAHRSIQCEILPTMKAAESYNRSKRRKAALMHVSC
jgi:glucokinase